MFRITSTNPDHKAASFNYPELGSLPPIATVALTKLREYTKRRKGSNGKKAVANRKKEKAAEKYVAQKIF